MEEVTETIADLSKDELIKIVIRRTEENWKYAIKLKTKNKKIEELEEALKREREQYRIAGMNYDRDVEQLKAKDKEIEKLKKDVDYFHNNFREAHSLGIDYIKEIAKLKNQPRLDKKEIEKIIDDILDSEWNNSEEKIITMTDQDNIIKDICKLRPKNQKVIAEGGSFEFWRKLLIDYNNDGSEFFKKVQGKKVEIILKEE